MMSSKPANDHSTPSGSPMNDQQLGQHQPTFSPPSKLAHSPKKPSPLRQCQIASIPAFPNVFPIKRKPVPYLREQSSADYLRELRTNRAVKLNGSRPPPPSRIASTRQRPSTSAGESTLPFESPQAYFDMDEPAQTGLIDYRAHGRAKSMDTGGRINFAGRPLFPTPSAVRSLPLIPDVDEAAQSPSTATHSRSDSHNVHSLGKALDDVHLHEEIRIHSAAQDEAAELVHKHRTGVKDSPSSAYKNPDVFSEQPKKDYRAHLRTRSALPWNSPTGETPPKATPPRPGPFVTSEFRPASSPSALNRVNARPSLATTLSEQVDPFLEPVAAPHSSKGKSYEKLAGAVATDVAQSRRRASSGANKRKTSEGAKAAFPSPDERIFEEVDDSLKQARLAEAEKAAEQAQAKAEDVPRYARRNPFARVRLAQEKFEGKESPSGYSVKRFDRDDSSRAVSPAPGNRFDRDASPRGISPAPGKRFDRDVSPRGISPAPGKRFGRDDSLRGVSPAPRNRFDRIEIHRNPPSQSRRAGYTTNDTPPATPSFPAEEIEAEVNPLLLKDGKELRGDDIRSATAMRRKDRSSNLIQPTAVSDSPGRPIVSFQNNWGPKEIELKEERVEALSGSSVARRAPSPDSISGKARPYSPTGRRSPSPASSQFRVQQSTHVHPPIPHVAVPDPPSITFDFSGPQGPVADLPRGIPTINIPDDLGMPSIVLPEEPDNKPRVPVVNEPFDGAKHARAPRPLPTPTRSSASKPAPSRPLPVTANTSPFPAAAYPHYTPSVRRNTALCSHCALPIAGRILSAAGERFHPACFKCHECNINLECVAFYPEPDNKRLERLARIQQRQQGLDVYMPEGVTEEDMMRLEEQDGDEALRFFCHLDFHESFSPKCKSCKTPIEGEVVVACGAEWHVGHFFCAQCGDVSVPLMIGF